MSPDAVLTSNGLPLKVGTGPDARMRDSTSRLADPAALRRRYQRDGYLLLRQVLDPDLIWRLRDDYFSRFDPSYLRAGTTPAEGIFSGHRPPLPAHGVAGHPAHGFVREPHFERLATDARLASLATFLLNGPVTVLPRRIVRHFDRAEPGASRAHTDLPYLSEGSEEVVTVWIPLGDCPPASGGLIYLDGSHRLDPRRFEPLQAVSDRPDDRRSISHDLQWVADQLGRRWRWADFAAGDLAMHSPRIVHASLDTTTDAMRLSADLRFLRTGQRPDPRWMVPWAGDDGN